MSDKNKLEAQANGKPLDEELLTTVSGGCGVCGEDDCVEQHIKYTNEPPQDNAPLSPLRHGSDGTQDRYAVIPRRILP